MTAQRDILILGLNPAWQKTLVFGGLHFGEVNRAESVVWQASGKGINAARALHGRGVPATVVQFAGGDTGLRLRRALDAEGIAHASVLTASETRVCTTLLSQHPSSMTELIEPSGPVTADEMRRLRGRLDRLLPRCRAVAICGTCPPGVPDRLYADVVAAARGHALVLLDGYRRVGDALAAGPHVLKINRRELEELTGESRLPETGSSRGSNGSRGHSPSRGQNASGSSGGFPLSGGRAAGEPKARDLAVSGTLDVPAAARALLARYPVGCVAVTDGPDKAFLVTRDRAWRYAVPRLGTVVSPLGAGDCASAVMLAECLAAFPGDESPDAWLRGNAIRGRTPALAVAFARALAAASASCTTSVPGDSPWRLARRLATRIAVR